MDTGLVRFLLGLFGSEVPESGVEASAIVVAFDVGEQVTPRLAAGMNRAGFAGGEFPLATRP